MKIILYWYDVVEVLSSLVFVTNLNSLNVSGENKEVLVMIDLGPIHYKGPDGNSNFVFF